MVGNGHTGYGKVQQQGWPRAYYFPKEHEEINHVLYAEGVGVPILVEGPSLTLWPEMAR